MKFLFTVIFIIASQFCSANMASPVREGTYSSSAFSSRDVDILKEKIIITPDSEFRTALFSVEYLIKTETDGVQIPLLFHAADYKGDFKVRVDNSEVMISDIPPEFQNVYNSPFTKFSGSVQGQNEVVIYWTEKSGNVYSLNDLKYFETNLSKGEHKISVEYIANVWTDRSGWIKEYSFRYSLSPAKYWKSFGSLEIILNSGKFGKQVTSNLNSSPSLHFDSLTVWTYDKLPGNYFQINYTPEVSTAAKILLSAGTDGLTLFFALLLIIPHLILILKFRKLYPQKKYSWILISGSILIPLLILIFYIYSYELIDNVIGEEAGRYHGYVFMVIVIYPLFMPLYWLVMWVTDKFYRRKLNLKF